MKRTTLTFLITALFALSLLIGCGGGGGGGSDSGNPPKPTQAIVKLSALANSMYSQPSNSLAGAQAILHLPTGVWVDADPVSTVTSTNVVVGSGNAANASPAYGVYTSASPTVGIYIIKASGFSYPLGEFATVTCKISGVATPQASDFTVTDLVVSDTTGTIVTGLDPYLSVTFQ